MVSADAKNEKFYEAWKKLMDEEYGSHVINMLLEKLNVDLAGSYAEAKRCISERTKGILDPNNCYIPSKCKHRNAQAQKAHFDRDSLWTGYDVISPYGDYRDCDLHFPGSNVSIPSRPGDITLIRGGAMKHGVFKWKGSSRIVFAPFMDARLFPFLRVPVPQSLGPIYGKWHGELAKKYPARNIEDLRTGPSGPSPYR